MKENLKDNVISAIVIFLSIICYCCSDVKIRDVTKEINFKRNCVKMPSSNLVSFDIQKIEIINAERSPNLWVEGGMSVAVWLMIVNELQYDVCIPTVLDRPSAGSCFIGITTLDTIDFYHSLYEDEAIYVSSKDSLLIRLACIGGAFDDLIDYNNHGDNRKAMYKAIEKMCFYFIPAGYENDPLLFNKKQNLNVSKQTKVITNSVVRIK